MPLPHPLTFARSRPFLTFFILVSLFFALSHPFTTSSSLSRSQPFPNFENDEYTYPSHPSAHAHASDPPKRVAIVGAGASGSAAAFFLARAARVAEDRAGLERGKLLGEITVFEKEDYIGGRSTTVYPHSDERYPPIELGASIFVDSNRHLMKAVKLFNLSLVNPDYAEAGIGIWDGTSFLFTTSTTPSRWSGWWDKLSAIRRYGATSPLRTQSAVTDLLQRFKNLYNPLWLVNRGTVASVEDFAEHAGLGNELTTRKGEDWARNVVKVGEKWMSEIMEGSTRVNYAADMSTIHALGAAVSLASGGASAVEGGNWQIFERMLHDSGAAVYLGTEVGEIDPEATFNDNDSPKFRVRTNVSIAGEDELYDQIFFAAPWHLSPIEKSLHAQFTSPIPPQTYVHLHVTLLTTTSPHPLPSFFKLPSTSSIPTTILTTSFTSRTHAGVPPPSFQSITYHGETYPGSGEWVVKIFSLSRISDHFLRELFGEEGEPTWVLRKEWDSYPELKPIAAYAPVEPVKGLQYLAAMEPWVSTMETQTLSAREAVARVVERWWGLGMGECRGGTDSWDWTCEE